MLNEEFVSSMMQAEKKNDFSYVHEGNALKRKSNEMQSIITGLEEALQTLQVKVKSKK